MSLLNKPPGAGGYLHQVLVDGVTPFRYRNSVRTLLGMPDREASTDSADSSLPSVEFLYTMPQPSREAMSPANSALGWSDLGWHNEEWQDLEDSPRGDRPHPPAHQLGIPIALPTPPTSPAQQPAFDSLESRQPQPLSPTTDLPDSSAIKAIAPVNTTDLPVREARSDNRLDNLPTAITIPGITGHRSLVAVTPKSPRPTNTNAVTPQAVDSNSISPRPISNLLSRKIVSESPDISAENPQILAKDSTTKGVVVQPIAVSLRTQASTSINLMSTEDIAVGDTPTPMSQSHPHARLPITATPIPMASVSNLPTSPSIAPQATSRMTEEIARLRRTVAELAAQVTTQRDFQPPATPIVLPTPVRIIERPVLPAPPPRAFWERSYLSRLYRWSRG